MKVYEYKNYDEYINAQISANKRKIKKVYVQERVIKHICKYLKTKKDKISFGLCHGTRRGVEQQFFKEHLGCQVLGTEISDTATQFPDTIQWDFHKVKPEWIGSCDFIYSNSLDHAFNPKKALKSWLDCLSPDGILCLEWAESFKKHPKTSNFTDPFSCSHENLIKMITDIGGKVLDVVKIENYRNSNKAKIIYIKRGI